MYTFVFVHVITSVYTVNRRHARLQSIRFQCTVISTYFIGVSLHFGFRSQLNAMHPFCFVILMHIKMKKQFVYTLFAFVLSNWSMDLNNIKLISENMITLFWTLHLL